MNKKLDNLFSALMLPAAIAVIITGTWVLSHSIERAVDCPPPERPAAEVAAQRLRVEPLPTPTPIPKPEEDYSYIPLDKPLAEALVAACAEYDVPLNLALGLIEVESRFQVDAVSSEGCVGLMQILPKYAWVMEEATGCSYRDPAGNIRCGVWYLSSLIDQYNGSAEKALVCYNQGDYRGVVTQYARNVLAAAERWGEKGESWLTVP